jgi:serine/threonine protein kinase
MSFIGRRLGSFTVHSLLGAGGMGEVYRAHDTRLGRDVAIKIPPVWVIDAERRARFDREARTLASLNHPHIGAIYGIEDVDDSRALVLELVEGPTLADRLVAGALPIREALLIASQIADALDAAHHRPS